MKKILITGANGQLGRALMTALVPLYPVTGAKIENESMANPELPYIQMDLTNRSQIEAALTAIQPDIIINTAAYTNVDGSEKNPALAKSVNVDGLENLTNLCAGHTRIIHISSDYVFDGDDGPYRESDKTNPTSFYGKTKLWAEQILQNSSPPHLIFRPNVLFQSTTHDQASFFAWVYTSLRNHKMIRVVTDQTSNPTWVHPFTDVILKSIESGLEGIYHYGSADYFSRFEFARLIADVFKLDSSLITPVLTEDLNQAAPRPKHSGLITEKIQSDLGVNVFTVEECLNRIKFGWEQPHA